MNILLISTRPSSDSGGGMARLVYELADALAGRHRVLFMHPGAENHLTLPQPGRPGTLLLRSFGSGEIYVPDLRASSWRWLMAALNDFKPDLIHAQDFSAYSALAQDWALSHKLPFLLTLHLLPTHLMAAGAEEQPMLVRLLGGGSIFRHLVLRFLQRSTAMTALNRAQSADLRAFGYTGHLDEVPNARNLALFGAIPTADISSYVKNLLFVGSFTAHKNQLYLLRVLQRLPASVHLTLLGEAIDPGYYHRLQLEEQQAGLAGRLTLSQVPFSAIPSYLQAAHLFVSASTMEVQSLAVLEALASGTPVVGLANPTIDELVDDSVGRRLPADAPPEAFAAQVQSLLGLAPEAYTALSAAARERVQAFSWEAVTERLTGVYGELAGERSRLSRPPVWTPWLRSLSWLAWSLAGKRHRALI